MIKVLLDLSKVFDCIPYDYLIAKLNAFEFDKEVLKLILKGKKQSAHINNDYNNFLELLSGVSEGSKLRVLLFNIFLKLRKLLSNEGFLT